MLHVMYNIVKQCYACVQTIQHKVKPSAFPSALLYVTTSVDNAYFCTSWSSCSECSSQLPETLQFLVIGLSYVFSSRRTNW